MSRSKLHRRGHDSAICAADYHMPFGGLVVLAKGLPITDPALLNAMIATVRAPRHNEAASSIVSLEGIENLRSLENLESA